MISCSFIFPYCSITYTLEQFNFMLRQPCTGHNKVIPVSYLVFSKPFIIIKRKTLVLFYFPVLSAAVSVTLFMISQLDIFKFWHRDSGAMYLSAQAIISNLYLFVGDHQVDICYFGQTIPSSPFVAKVWDASKVVVAPITSARAGVQSAFCGTFRFCRFCSWTMFYCYLFLFLKRSC